MKTHEKLAQAHPHRARGFRGAARPTGRAVRTDPHAHTHARALTRIRAAARAAGAGARVKVILDDAVHDVLVEIVLLRHA
eukprot:887349-Prymnesium_polylepis.1